MMADGVTDQCTQQRVNLYSYRLGALMFKFEMMKRQSGKETKKTLLESHCYCHSVVVVVVVVVRENAVGGAVVGIANTDCDYCCLDKGCGFVRESCVPGCVVAVAPLGVEAERTARKPDPGTGQRVE